MAILNLVAADLKRLKKDKATRTILIINISLILLFALFLVMIRAFALTGIMSMTENGEPIPDLEDIPIEEIKSILNPTFAILVYLITFANGFIGLFITIAVAIFIGKDYSFNTIRNKIISGNSRVKIYLSAYCTAVIIGLIFYIINCAFTFLITTAFFGFVSTGGILLKTIILTLPIYLSIIAIVCFISMTMKSLSMGLVINILAAILLPNILSTIFSLATKSVAAQIMQYYPAVILSELLAMSAVGSISLDMSGMLQTMPALSTSIILRSTLVPIAYIAAFCAGGAMLFKNTDIK